MLLSSNQSLFSTTPVSHLGWTRRQTSFPPEYQHGVDAATVLIMLTAQAANPDDAAALANGVARSYAEVAPRLENKDNPVLQADIVEAAVAPDRASGPPARATALTGAVAGLTVGLLACPSVGRLHALCARHPGYCSSHRDGHHRGAASLFRMAKPPPCHDLVPGPAPGGADGGRFGGRNNPYAHLYSRLGLGSLASRPHVLVVVPTAAGTTSASVAAGLAATCLASGQRCVVVAPTAATAEAIEHNESLSGSSPGLPADLEVLTPERLQMSEGGVLTLEHLEAALLMVSDAADVVIVAARGINVDANTRTFLKLGGDVILTTPLKRPRMRTLRQTSELITQSGGSIVAVAAISPQKSLYPAANPAELEPELMGTGS